MAGVTEGRWRARRLFPDDPRWAVEPESGGVVAVTTQENDEGNATLMAAAPAMRDALEAWRAAWSHHESCVRCGREPSGAERHCPEGCRMRQEAMALTASALAAAGGGEVAEWSSCCS